MFGYLKRIWSAREVVQQLVVRDIKLRYKGSALGFLWSFLRPLMMMVILTVVFSLLLRFPMAYEIPCRFARGWTNATFPIFLLVALLPWFFTLGGLNDALNSLLANAALIKKVAVPAEVFPLSAVLANLVHFLLSLLVFVPILMILFEVPLRWPLVWIPALIVVQFLLTLGLSLILSFLNVFFRDVAIIFELISMMWFYLTPIFYPLMFVYSRLVQSGRADWATEAITAYMLNPMAILVILYRKAFLAGAPVADPSLQLDFSRSQAILGGTSLCLWTIAALAIGCGLYSRYRKNIPDEL